jgi:hypothetical protein
MLCCCRVCGVLNLVETAIARHSPHPGLLWGLPSGRGLGFFVRRKARNSRLNPNRQHQMLKRPGLGLLLAAALANVAWAQSSTKFDGQYVGELTLTKVTSGDCTPPPLGAIYPLTISGGQVQFKYDPRFDTILRGKVDENGTFKASRLLRRGRITMTGHIQGNNVSANIKSPSCRYTFQTRG